MNEKSIKEPQISLELDGSVIQLSLSKFNDILEREITNFILKNNTVKKNIINPNELKKNIEFWKSKYEKMETSAKIFDSVVKRLEKDLNTDKLAQPQRCKVNSFCQNVNITRSNKLIMANAHSNSHKEHEIMTVLDSEDEIIMIKTEQQIKNENVIDLIYSDNDTQNGNDRILPISTEIVKSSTIVKDCMSASSLPRQKPCPQSKKRSVDIMDPSDALNNKTVGKKIPLSDCGVINDNKSVKALKVAEKYNHNFCSKFLNPKYPPPYPLIPPHKTQPTWKNVPPIPKMKIQTSRDKVVLIWDLNLTCQTADIKMYELFVCQETDAYPDISMWHKKGEIESELLPMACELEVFKLGFIYHFALRAVDVHDRRAPFAVVKTKI